MSRELEALRAMVDAEPETCSRCEGSGELWADGQAHSPTYKGATRSCPVCGGVGSLPPYGGPSPDDLRAILARMEAAERVCKAIGNADWSRNIADQTGVGDAYDAYRALDAKAAKEANDAEA